MNCQGTHHAENVGLGCFTNSLLYLHLVHSRWYIRCAVVFMVFLALGYSMGMAQSVVGITVGANSYVGELSPRGGSPQITIGASYQHYFEDRLFLRAGLQVGSIEGSYEPGDELNLISGIQDRTEYFSATVATVNLSLNWEFFQFGFAHIYGGVGFGILNYTIVDQQERDLTDRSGTRLAGEDYVTRVAQVPINGGIILFPEKKINLVVEQSWVLTNTDYLDNIGYAGSPGSDTIIRRTLSVRYNF